MTVFPFNMLLANQNWDSKIPHYIRLFESLENLYPTKGSAKVLSKGLIDFFFQLLSSYREKKLKFLFWIGYRTIFFQKTFIPQRGVQKRSPGVQFTRGLTFNQIFTYFSDKLRLLCFTPTSLFFSPNCQIIIVVI